MKNKLQELIEKELRFGEYTLKCGKKSNCVLDLSRALRRDSFISALTGAIEAIELPEFQAIGGSLCASDMVCLAINNAFYLDMEQGWFGVRPEPKGRGFDTARITGNLEKGQHVLMVEDVCTSGASLSDAIEAVIEFGAIPVAAFCIVDRPEYGGIKSVGEKYNIPTQSLFELNNGILTSNQQ